MNRQPRPGYLAMGNLFHGTYYLTQSGTAEKPIVIKAVHRFGDMSARQRAAG
jgi:hypothetical protein